MSHLTTTEILQIVDGTIAIGEKTRLIGHMDSCPICRRELQFHRMLGQAAREAPLAKPSRGFTASVVKRVAPAAKRSWMSSVVNNLGNFIAMALVLSVVWFAVNSTALRKQPVEPSGISKVFALYVEYYAKAREAASKQVVKVVGEPKKEQNSKSPDVAMLTLISLLILVGIDRFVVRRVIKIHH
jgi:hypothetical protein